uniref:Vps72/YL1 C-terminal domain-containing protein n=1 Tax=Babesia bovis TaxID=5865 RepID=S6B3Q6_BABBO|nr:hypothetical protein [Babesia bovis]
MERKRDLIKTEMSAGAAHKRQETKKKHLTQEQLMEMALKNEAANTRSLEKMKAWEDEKKYYEEIKKWNYKGNYDIWVCWNSLLSIVGKATEEGQEAPTIPSKHDVEKPLELYMFTSGKVPEYYEEAVASFNDTKEALTQICAITGKPARYLDPLTKCYYSGSDAFNALRMCHADGIDRHVAAELDRWKI